MANINFGFTQEINSIRINENIITNDNQALKIVNDLYRFNKTNKSPFKFIWDTLISYGSLNKQIRAIHTRTFDKWGKPTKMSVISYSNYLKTYYNIYIYDINGNLIIEQSKYYDGYPDIWRDYKKIEYSYDNLSRLTDYINYFSDNGTWYYENKYSYTYDNLNNIKTITQSVYDYTYTNNWNANFRDTIIYDTMNRVIEITQYYNPDNVYQPGTSEIYSYDSNGNINNAKHYRWSATYQGAWYTIIEQEDSFYYYDNNSLRYVKSYKWNYPCGGGYVITTQLIEFQYKYNDAGDLILKKCIVAPFADSPYIKSISYIYDQWQNSIKGKAVYTNNKSSVPPILYNLSLELYSQQNSIMQYTGPYFSNEYYAHYQAFIAPSEVNTLNADKIEIFPNPSNEFLTISNSKNLPINKISFFNLLGQNIFNLEINGNKEDIKIDLNNFEKGPYLLLIYTDNEILSRKIIVTK